MSAAWDPYEEAKGAMYVSEPVIIDIMPFFGMHGELDDSSRYATLAVDANVTVWLSIKEDDEAQPRDEAVQLRLKVLEHGTVDFYLLAKETGEETNHIPTPPNLPPNMMFEAEVVRGSTELEDVTVFGMIVPSGTVALICSDPRGDKTRRLWRASQWLHLGEDEQSST